MKKTATYILLAVFFLNITSCDFLRRIAGRPTSGDIESKCKAIELKQKRMDDSLRLAAQIEKKRLDSLAKADFIKSCGIKFSDVFYYGEPLVPLEHRFHLVTGVFKTGKMLDRHVARMKKAGYDCTIVSFPGGAKAVAICATDSMDELASTVVRAENEQVTPTDAWVHVNNRK